MHILSLKLKTNICILYLETDFTFIFKNEKVKQTKIFSDI